MKKQYIKPETEEFSLYGGMVILADSGQGGGDDPVTPVTGDASIGGGGNDGEPIEEGGAPGFFDMDDF